MAPAELEPLLDGGLVVRVFWSVFKLGFSSLRDSNCFSVSLASLTRSPGTPDHHYSLTLAGIMKNAARVSR